MTVQPASGRAGLVGLLVILGAGWGITQPLAKIAVSEGYEPLGLVFWQFTIGAVVLGALVAVRGQRLPFAPGDLRLYAVIALIGTLLPNSASYEAAKHLPSGVISILLSTIPMMAFPIALALGLDRFSAIRLGGLGCGLAGVLLIVGPEASLPDPAMLAFVPLALVAPFFYACEGNVLARFGMRGLDPVRLLLGASIVGAVMALPLTLMLGVFIVPKGPAEWGAPDTALVASALVHAVVYASYFFATQVSYLVTGFGVFWAKLLLGESYSPFVWAALALMMVGLALVQPRPSSLLVPGAARGQDAG